MLNRAKVLKALQTVTDKLFLDTTAEYNLAKEVWQRICNDETFQDRVSKNSHELMVPIWSGRPDQIIQIKSYTDPYHVFSVDGSQIYPDRHQGTSCYLINIGLVQFSYGHARPVYFATEPYVFVEDGKDDFDISTDLVNCRRQELELQGGLEMLQKWDEYLEQSSVPVLFFDGSLVFWHLQAKEQKIKDHFLCRYIMQLSQLCKQNIPVAGYISLPKSKELVNLIRLAHCDFDTSNTDVFHAFDTIVDATVASFFLPVGFRTTVFENQSSIAKLYSNNLKPHFFYCNFGAEIVRIEVPAYVARDESMVDYISAVALDQVQKGLGYPIVLAEAHEQAVVKGPDRDFFYHVVQKLGISRKKKLSISQKSIKKRIVGV